MNSLLEYRAADHALPELRVTVFVLVWIANIWTAGYILWRLGIAIGAVFWPS